MQYWPLSIPQHILRESFEFSPESRVVAFSTEVGGGKQRRRSTARTKKMRALIRLTKSEYRTFEEWFEDDLQDGVLDFTMPDPMDDDGGTMVVSFIHDSGDPYSVAPAGVHFTISMNLRRKPA